MTDTKKLRYPTKFLSRIIRELKKPDKIAWLFPNDIPMLTEIKGIVEYTTWLDGEVNGLAERNVMLEEKLKLQPQPDEELDTFFCDLYYDYTAGFCNLQDGDKPHEEDEAKIKQIRKLLKGEI